MVETREQAEEAVRSDKQTGYVAIKVVDRLSKEAYEAIVSSARREGLPVVGHIPTAVGLSGAIAARQDSIEHLYFWNALQPDDSTGQNKSSSEMLQHADLKKLPALVQAMKAADMWNCPTLVLYDRPRTDAVWLEEKALVPPDLLERLKKMYPNVYVDPARSSPEGHALSLAIVTALHAGGAHLLLGTDAVKTGTLPGFSLHDELAYFVVAGMTPYEAIRAGTSDAAIFLQQENEFGVVATGRRADLLLVEANPLEDVKNVAKRAGVMINGHWLSEEELKQRLAALKASYQH